MTPGDRVRCMRADSDHERPLGLDGVALGPGDEATVSEGDNVYGSFQVNGGWLMQRDRWVVMEAENG